MTIKVKNNKTGEVYIHENLTQEEIEWIRLDPNLEVEIIEK